MQLSFYYLYWRSQDSLVGFGISYKFEPFSILKASYLTDQLVYSGEAGYIP